MCSRYGVALTNRDRELKFTAGKRVRIVGTGLRGVIAEQLEGICLVYRDDTNTPKNLLYHTDSLELD